MRQRMGRNTKPNQKILGSLAKRSQILKVKWTLLKAVNNTQRS